MIYPMSMNPSEINATMVRIADEHNADIDIMTDQINKMRASQQEISDRFESQQRRWDNYQASYKDTLNAFYAQTGKVTENDLLSMLDWSTF
jgi:predicted nucleic acid-binding protein